MSRTLLALVLGVAAATTTPACYSSGYVVDDYGYGYYDTYPSVSVSYGTYPYYYSSWGPYYRPYYYNAYRYPYYRSGAPYYRAPYYRYNSAPYYRGAPYYRSHYHGTPNYRDHRAAPYHQRSGGYHARPAPNYPSKAQHLPGTRVTPTPYRR
jgi:hypothetical protein